MAVERLFSRGRQLISPQRNRLSGKSIRALLCLGEWSGMGLVLDKDIMVVTRQNVEDLGDADFEPEDGYDAL